MKKRIVSLCLVFVLVCAVGVAASAAEVVDIADTLSTSFTAAIGEAMGAMAALLPIGLQVFALVFAVKKGMEMFRASTKAG